MLKSNTLPQSLADWLVYIEALHPKTIAMGLERVEVVRSRLNLNPDFPIITVSGTNGKGSTCAMLERIYQIAGYNVACYTSPHLLTYNERIRIHGIEITDSELCQSFVAVENARKEIALTYFEFGTLAAMWHMIKKGVDLAILEVGLGGRLDAVNVFEPDCSIVTNIDIDHVEFLGNTRESIGYEKAGIFRKCVPAICGDYNPPVTLIDYAKKIEAELYVIGCDFQPKSIDKFKWAYQSTNDSIQDLPIPKLEGSFQISNACCVIKAISLMQEKLPLGEEHIVNGLNSVELKGRFQTLSTNPDVILDVAHNPHAARTLSDNLKRTTPKGKTIAVFSMLADKDIGAVVNAVGENIDTWFVSENHNPRSAKADFMADIIKAYFPLKNVKIFNEVSLAFRQACLDACENDRILVFGSFYTVAEVMHHHRNMNSIQ